MAHPSITGIHHITAISSAAAENLDFYERVLGLRLVKQTVNFDDPYTYHLYYGAADGAPGTILTFFPWERMPSGRPAAGMIVATAFAVPRAVLPYWVERLSTSGATPQTESRFGETVLRFSDPHGLPLELIGTDALPTASALGRKSGRQGARHPGFSCGNCVGDPSRQHTNPADRADGNDARRAGE